MHWTLLELSPFWSCTDEATKVLAGGFLQGRRLDGKGEHFLNFTYTCWTDDEFLLNIKLSLFKARVLSMRRKRKIRRIILETSELFARWLPFVASLKATARSRLFVLWWLSITTSLFLISSSMWNWFSGISKWFGPFRQSLVAFPTMTTTFVPCRLSTSKGGTKYEELTFGAKFLAFLDLGMHSVGRSAGGNDGGRQLEEEILGQYKHKVVQKINVENVTAYPWIEAFHDQLIALLRYLKKMQTRTRMRQCLDEDDMIRDCINRACWKIQRARLSINNCARWI